MSKRWFFPVFVIGFVIFTLLSVHIGWAAYVTEVRTDQADTVCQRNQEYEPVWEAFQTTPYSLKKLDPEVRIRICTLSARVSSALANSADFDESQLSNWLSELEWIQAQLPMEWGMNLPNTVEDLKEFTQVFDFLRGAGSDLALISVVSGSYPESDQIQSAVHENIVVITFESPTLGYRTLGFQEMTVDAYEHLPVQRFTISGMTFASFEYATREAYVSFDCDGISPELRDLLSSTVPDFTLIYHQVVQECHTSFIQLGTKSLTLEFPFLVETTSAAWQEYGLKVFQSTVEQPLGFGE